jgi:hypothetical protein
MKFKNIQETSGLTCNCSSWLNHWLRFTNNKAVTFCAELNCTKIAEVGGHVIACDSANKSWRILPLCRAHNLHRFKECFAVKPQMMAVQVTANVSKSCK